MVTIFTHLAAWLDRFTLGMRALAGGVGVFGLLWLIPYTRRIFFSSVNRRSLAWALFIAYESATLGAYLAVKDTLRFETAREQQEEQKIFGDKLTALSFETACNLYLIKELRSTLNSPVIDIRELRVDTANTIVDDYITYADGSQGLFQPVWAMVAAIDEVNNLTDVVIDNLENRKGPATKTLNAIKRALDRAEGSILAVRKQLEVYKLKFPPAEGWEESTPEQIQSILNGSKT